MTAKEARRLADESFTKMNQIKFNEALEYITIEATKHRYDATIVVSDMCRSYIWEQLERLGYKVENSYLYENGIKVSW